MEKAKDPRIQVIKFRGQIVWTKADKILSRHGYVPHLKGWTKTVDKKKRFHIDIVNSTELELHMDTTINGRHVLDYNELLFIEAEKLQEHFGKIKSKEEKKLTKQQLRKKNTAPFEAQRFSTIVRSRFNPLRYLIGKFKYIQK